MIKEVKGEEFAKELNNKKVVVDFFANWCGPCKMLSPILEKISADKSMDGIVFLKVNVDENQQLAAKYNVSALPTVITFTNGEEDKRMVGYKPEDVVKEELDLVRLN